MAALRIDIWSDIACPWCYIGKRRMEAALSTFAHRGEVEIVWRSFELDPSAPRVFDGSVPFAARLARKYGVGVAQAEGMIRRVADVAAGDGLAFRMEKVRGGNTFDAHRVLHLARERGLQDTVKERFFKGYFIDGEAIGDPEAIARMAREAGLDGDEVAATLASDAHAREVRADQAEAREHGISGVPFFAIGRYAVSGAQPVELISRALDKAWSESAPKDAPAFAEGAACGPDGCA